MASCDFSNSTITPKVSHRLKSLIDQRFGRLVVLSRSENDHRNKTRWNCICDCGTPTLALAFLLHNGHIRSCGCLQREATGNRARTHGKGHASEYKIWSNIKQRCLNPLNPAYANYGGRGITICPEWEHNFLAFLVHVGERPGPKYTIDRIDNAQGYRPGNVVWATRLQQNRNQRSNINLTLHGRTQCITAWSEEIGIKKGTLRGRKDLGWSDENALLTPIKTKKDPRTRTRA